MNTQPSQLQEAQPDNNTEISALYQKLLGAWNKRNAADFAGLFAEKGNLVGFDGSPIDGRTAIEAHLRQIFADVPFEYGMTVRDSDQRCQMSAR